MSIQNLFGVSNTSNAQLANTTTTASTNVFGGLQNPVVGQQLGPAGTVYPYNTGYVNITPSKPPPNTLQALQMLPAGWRYIRWKPPVEEGGEARVECVPIIGIGVKEGRDGMADSYNYLLAESQPSPYGADWESHVAVLSPVDTYAEDLWLGRAREKYREHRARQVAAILTRQSVQQAMSAK